MRIGGGKVGHRHPLEQSARPAAPDARRRYVMLRGSLSSGAARIGKVKTHIACLLCGAAGFGSFLVVRDPRLLLVSEIGVGIAWASILAMPYAILASSLPQAKLGIYMGLFNVFIVVPQLLVATVMGSVLKTFFPTEPIWTMAFAALVMALAALAMLRVPETGERRVS